MSSPTPSPYHRIKIVRSFDELVSTRFEDGINALCLERSLPGDFDEIAAQLGVKEGRLALDEDTLNGLSLSPEGAVARAILLQDRKLLSDQGLSPVLDCIHGYPRDEEGGPIVTDVYSFHADSAPVEADTYLCSYNQTASEGLANEEAVKRVDLPEVRAELLKLYEGGIYAAGRKSAYSLYNPHIATMEADATKAYNQDDATGFIRLNGLRLKVGATVEAEVNVPKKAASAAKAPKAKKAAKKK